MEEIKKMYWSIGDIADELCLSVSSIRFIEKYFDLKVPRTDKVSGFGKKGNRVYNQKLFNKFKYIRYLLYDEGYRYDGALKKYKEKQNEHKRNIF